MRVVITGGAGFIGRAIVERLAKRGDEVVALVRDPARVRFLLHDDRVELVPSDLSSIPQLKAQVEGADALIHGAGMYRIGIKRSERDAMWDANVGATERVLDAGLAAGIARIVYISTANVFGNTRGEVVDETFKRDEKLGFVSYYDETKYRAHQAAESRIADGAPIVIVMPAQVYGPNDHSQASSQINLAYRGKLRFASFATAGLAWVHVHDLAAGIIAALDRGRIGESYALAGEPLRMNESVAVAARLGGHKPPRLTLPVTLVKALAPINDLLGGLPGYPANMRETISAAQDVTYWAKSDKAAAELGFRARPFEQGIRDTWGPGRSKPRAKVESARG